MRVSTSFLYDTALSSMQDSNTRLEKLTFQLTSGLKSESFGDLGADTNQLLNLKDLQKTAGTYIKNIETANARLEATENALQSLSDIILEASQLWTLAANENSAEIRAGMAPKAEGLAKSFVNTLKTRFDGRYIFSGMAGNNAPITVSATANTYPGDPPPTTYYQGDSAKMQVVTGTSLVEEYGVTGDHMAFARMKSGLEALWYGLSNNSTSDIDNAIDQLEQAQEDLNGVLGDIGGQLNSFDLMKERHENSNLFLQNRIDDLEKADTAEAMTKFTQEQSILESSMLVITRLNGLSLLDFIR